MGEGPLVSVIIPTWNRRQLVQQAIASVVAQTYDNWEVIVVDDGSRDGTVEELRKLTDSRLRLIAASHSGVTAVSRNRGIEDARGELVAFLDSDDLWLPQRLETQVRALTQSGAGWCYCNYGLMDETGRDIPLRAGRFRPLSGKIIEPLLLGQTAVHVDCLLIRSDVLKSVGPFDPSLRRREDLDFDFRLALAAEAVALDRVLARVRDHPSRKTAGSDFAHEHTARVYRNFIAREPELPLSRIARKMLAIHLADAGADRIAARNFGVGAKLLGESVLLGAPAKHWLRAGVRGVRRLFAS